jgi:uncharacterized surface protein with fasciclin (FAS1) repeats/uncharacterized protein YegP (UPF0339 family)
METIARTLKGMDACSNMARALEQADILAILEGIGPFTVFVPENEAFEALWDPSFEELLEDADTLDEVMLYHIIRGSYSTNEIRALAPTSEPVVTANTAQGETIRIGVGDALTANGTPVESTDIICKNGIIHCIKGVLWPPLLLPSSGATDEPCIEISQDPAGSYRYVVRDADGTVLALGQGHVSKEDCVRAVERLREIASAAKLIERTE